LLLYLGNYVIQKDRRVRKVAVNVSVTLPRILEEENGEEQNTEDDECAAGESEILAGHRRD